MTRLFTTFFAGLLMLLPVAALAYQIQPGDQLQIEVVEDNALNRVLLVLPDGTINFPGAGSIRASGMTAEGLRVRITDRIAGDFASRPTVYVSVAQLAPPPAPVAPEPDEPQLVYIMGEVEGPGAMPVEEGITLLQAIAQAGGFTRFAATKRVELRRVDSETETERVFLFDYKNRTGISGATRLTAGDVIVVPERRLFE
ncbi:polysaccharide biosynthesis/export family protein [Aestuariibius sp. HNIBRBA575]|uniref:polysaccharide biosynthesis/export family protein n=1 Tax=Aestuariibius sp. HNIBRBA575 TaxID=3233343 RepID=UPI0034A33D37